MVLALASMAEVAEALVWQPPALQRHLHELSGYIKVVGRREMKHWAVAAEEISWIQQNWKTVSVREMKSNSQRMWCLLAPECFGYDSLVRVSLQEYVN
jgi:hypothetical protein